MKQIQYINLCDHPVKDILSGMEWEKSGHIVRVINPSRFAEIRGGVALSEHNPTAYVAGLPEPVEGVNYIVSSIIASFVQDRDDLVTVGPAVRDKKTNEVYACKGLRKVVRKVA